MKAKYLGWMVLGAGLLAAAWFGWSASRDRVVVADHLPARPDTASWPAEFTQRLTAADAQARGWFRTKAGLIELGRLYHANGFFAEARQCYRGLLQLEPRNPRWSYLLANILAGFGQLDEALPLLRTSVALDPDYPAAQLALAGVLLKTNQVPPARAVYEALLKQDPKSVHALLGLAQCAVQLQDWSGALGPLQKAVALQPEFFDGWSLLVTIHEQLGDPTAAAQARRQAIFSPPTQAAADPWLEALTEDCFDAYRVSVAAAASQDKIKARAWHARAIELAPNVASFRRHLGKLLLADKNYPAAITHLKKAAELNPEDSDAWAYLVQALREGGDLPAAEIALDTGLGHCPESGALHFAKGQQLHARGQIREAVAELMLSKKYAPAEPRAYIELALVYFRQERLDEGLAELRATLAIDPGHPLAMQILARNAMEEGDQVAARHWISELRRHARDAPSDITRLEGEFRQRFGRAP